jgi:site-specific recombinase XerD
VRGQRYRGSTNETKEARASKIAGLKLAQVVENTDPLPRKAPVLSEFSKRFLDSLDKVTLEDTTKTYYRDGWRLLQSTTVARMRLDQIATDDVEELKLPGSSSNVNCALRTLRRILHKAEEWKLIRRAPKLKLAKEYERELRLDDESERKLLAAAAESGWSDRSFRLFEDIIRLVRDTGMRNGRELYRMRIENLDWARRNIFVPDSKTPEGRRTIPMSDRVFQILRKRCGPRTSGWVFPSRRKNAKSPYLGSIAHHFREARRKAGFPEKLVLYCGRHDFGTVIASRTGNLKAVMKVMGHKDVKTAMKYQHPEIDVVRAALNQDIAVEAQA